MSSAVSLCAEPRDFAPPREFLLSALRALRVSVPSVMNPSESVPLATPQPLATASLSSLECALTSLHHSIRRNPIGLCTYAKQGGRGREILSIYGERMARSDSGHSSTARVWPFAPPVIVSLHHRAAEKAPENIHG